MAGLRGRMGACAVLEHEQPLAYAAMDRAQ